MDPKKYITVEDFNEYSKIVKNEFENLKKSLTESKSNETASVNEGLVKYTETVAKRVNQVQEYTERLAESVDGLISHNDYIIENLEKVKNYAELVGEKTSQGINYGEKLAESVDHLIEYTRLVASKADQGIEFSKYVANESNNRWNYQAYLNEQLDNVISHNDYIVEGTSSVIEYTEYLKEQTENLSNYMNHIVEKINEGAVFTTDANVEETEVVVNEGAEATKAEETVTLSFEEDLAKKIDSIVESAKAEKQASIVNNKLHFLNFISESKRNQFSSLNPEVKDKVIAAFEGNKFYGSVDAERIYESLFLTTLVPLNWLNNMPEKYKATWNGLNENQKTAIKAQASVKVLDTQYKIDDFWGTRDLRDVKVELNESTEPIVINESAKYESPAGYMETVESELKRRFKR